MPYSDPGKLEGDDIPPPHPSGFYKHVYEHNEKDDPTCKWCRWRSEDERKTYRVEYCPTCGQPQFGRVKST